MNGNRKRETEIKDDNNIQCTKQPKRERKNSDIGPKLSNFPF